MTAIGRGQPGTGQARHRPGRRRLVEHLQQVAHPVTTEQDYARVAAISANDDDTVGAVIAKALHTVGDGGIVTVEESPRNGMSVDFVEGFEFDNGYLSPYMVTNPASLEASSTTRTSCCAARRSPRSSSSCRSSTRSCGRRGR
jgi:chaperonin GroEL